MGQRISRAKKTLSEARAEFELPVGDERTARLDDVMAVVYLIFNEGYTATAGDDWMRPELTNEAIRLARMLAELMPDEPEVHGLQALLELQASRGAARVDAEGRPVLLDDQDRRLWDELLIRRGLAALDARRAARRAREGRSVATTCRPRSRPGMPAPPRPRRPTGAPSRICTTCSPRPRPARSWRSTAPWRTDGRPVRTPAWPCSTAYLTARSRARTCCRACAADLLARAGRHAEAAASFREAASLTRNESEQALLLGPRQAIPEGGHQARVTHARRECARARVSR